MSISVEEIVRRIEMGESLKEIGRALLPLAERELLRRCATVRMFDRQLFEEVLRQRLGEEDLSSVRFEWVVGQDAVEPVPRRDGFYRVRENVRGDYVSSWWKEDRAQPPAAPTEVPLALRRLSQRLVAYYESRGPGWESDYLFHQIAVEQAEAGALFTKLYRKADERFDLPRCYDLLSVLEQRIQLLRPKLQQLLATHRQYYRARGMWATEYYQTARYYERPKLKKKFEALLRSDTEWIIQIYSTGGMGKTMFVRWLASRYLVPFQRRIPCARIDFDLVNPVRLSREPWLMFLEVAQQLDQQIGGKPLYDLIEYLSQYKRILDQHDSPEQAGAWQGESAGQPLLPRGQLAAEVPDKFASAMLEAGVESHVVIILDTMEELLLRQGTSFLTLIEQLAKLHAGYPLLRVVICGRYDLDERVAGYAKNFGHVTQDVSLEPFTNDEARSYLKKKRRLTKRTHLEAIVKKAAGNPFKLSLLADIVLSAPQMGAGDILHRQYVDIVYLIRRVISRIEDVRVRWLVRYGVIPRTLTPRFIKEVMAKYLQEVVYGEVTYDAAQEDLAREGQEERPFTQLRREPGGPALDFDELWRGLSKYASENSWVSVVEQKADALRFHPEVVNPMRGLLQKRRIFRLLHEEAIRFYEAEAKAKPAEWGEHIREAVYHQFQLRGAEADAYWRSQIESECAAGNPRWRLWLAREVLGKEYLDADKNPRPRRGGGVMVSQETLARAYFERARARAELTRSSEANPQDSGWQEAMEDFEQFESLQRQIGTSLVPRARVALVRAHILAGRGELPQALSALEEGFGEGPAPAELIEMEVAYADIKTQQRNHREAVIHYLLARAVARSPGAVATPLALGTQRKLARSFRQLGEPISASQIYEDGVELARALGAPAAVVEFTRELAETRLLIGQMARAYDIAFAADAAVGPGDAVGTRVEKFRLRFTRGRVMLALREPLKALAEWEAASALIGEFEERAARKELPANLAAQLKAEAVEFRGHVLAELMEFRKALRELEHARILWQNVGATDDANRCFITSAEFQLFKVGNAKEAAALLENADRLVRSREDELWLRYQILRAAAAERVAKEHGQQQMAEILNRLYEKAHSQEAWPPAMAAQLEMAELVLLWKDAPADLAQRLARTMESIKPATARIKFMPFLRQCPTWPDSTEIVKTFTALLPEAAPGSRDFEVVALYLVEAHRVLGDRGRAAELLEKAAAAARRRPGSFILLEVLQAYSRLGVEAEGLDFAQWVRDFTAEHGGYPTLCGAVLIEYAHYLNEMIEMRRQEEAPNALRLEEASRALAAGMAYLHSDALISIWFTRAEKTAASLAAKLRKESESKAHSVNVMNYLDELVGDTEFSRKLQNQILDSVAVLTRDTSFVLTVDELSAAEGPLVKIEFPLRGQRQWRKPLSDLPRLADLPQSSYDEPVSYGLLKRIQHDFSGVSAEMGRLLLTEEDAAEIRRHGDIGPYDFRIEISDQSLSALPWELMQFPGPLQGVLSQSPSIRYVYRSSPKDAMPTGEVKWLQAALAKVTGEETVVDGSYGDQVREAVSRFQFAHGLDDDGIPGPRTKKLLRRLARGGRPLRMLVMQPSVGRSINIWRGAHARGLSLVKAYAGYGFMLELLENPTLESFAAAVAKVEPDIIHISATMKSAPSLGPYLDFGRENCGDVYNVLASSESFSFTGLFGPIKELTEGKHLRPILILDITRPPSLGEMLRQLCLRNAFASNLFRLGYVTAILATGLGGREEQEVLCQRISSGLAAEKPLGDITRAIHSLAAEADGAGTEAVLQDPHQLQRILPYAGTALFAYNPLN